MRLSLKKLLAVLGILTIAYTNTLGTPPLHVKKEVPASIKKTASVYDSLHLAGHGLSRQAYDYAVRGFNRLADKGLLKNDSVITIVDFDQPSYNKRMYILDIKNYKILFRTWAAHGKNTGRETANSFSNSPNSHKSSLGFYITEQTYNGENGYSLKLMGMEKSNCNAQKRAIVLHGAPYVSQRTIESMGFIGRSHGCPAVPTELSKPIINTIKNGSCLFIYNKAYLSSLSV